MIDATFDGATLTVHAKNKAARVALLGENHVDGDLVLRREQIAGVRLKEASMLVNGNLRVDTVDGKTFQLHFRKKQAEGFSKLAADLG